MRTSRMLGATVYANVEAGESAREDVGAAMRAILCQMASPAEYVTQDRTVARTWPERLATYGLTTHSAKL